MHGHAVEVIYGADQCFCIVAHAAVSTRLPLFAQSSHATVVAPTGVEE